MRFLSKAEKNLWQSTIFLSYKWHYFLVFIFLPIGLNIIYAIIQKSTNNISLVSVWTDISWSLHDTAVLSSNQIVLGLLFILAFAQVTLMIFLLMKIPKFFIKSGAIILGFFSIFNFFAVSLVSGVIVEIIAGIRHETNSIQKNNLELLVGTTLQVLSYVFIIWYAFRFCDTVRQNVLKPFCVPVEKSNNLKKSSKPNLKRKVPSSQAISIKNVIQKLKLTQINRRNDGKKNKLLRFSWRKFISVLIVFVTSIVLLSTFLIFTSRGSTNGNSSSNNQNALNSLFNNSSYGKILFIILVCSLAPIVEEISTRHCIISVLNFRQTKNGSLINPTLSNFKSQRKILYLVFSIIMSVYYFANMHIMFAPYSQIKSYLFIASVLGIIYLISNFVVGYTILSHSVFNCGVFFSGLLSVHAK